MKNPGPHSPGHGVGGGGHEGGGDGYLVLRPRRDVETLLPHDRHVKVVNQRQLQPLRTLVEVGIVE